MHTKKELDSRLAEAGVQPLKKLGQNFLVNPQICQKILYGVKTFNPQSVVEIGPGLGAITDDLLEGPWKTTIVELDSGLVKYWKTKHPELEAVHEDALKLDWSRLQLAKPSVLVSNLPYSIAASLVVEMSSIAEPLFDGMVLMFQKEVAQRIDAQIDDEDYGMLSIIAQSSWEIEKLVDAGPQDFHPVPNVGSRVLTFRWRPTDPDRLGLLKFLKMAFAQRRKKLVSNLGVRYKKDQIKGALSELGISEDIRAQSLSAEQMRSLKNLLDLSSKS